MVWNYTTFVLVIKKNGKVRPCVDYRRLNAVTIKDAFPLTRIQDCLDSVAGATIFNTFDLTSGYHKIPVRFKIVTKNNNIIKVNQTYLPLQAI
jgi:hypothetical protein